MFKNMIIVKKNKTAYGNLLDFKTLVYNELIDLSLSPHDLQFSEIYSDIIEGMNINDDYELTWF